MSLKLSCAALAALSLMASQAVAQEVAAPATQATPAEAAPAEAAAPVTAPVQDAPIAPAPAAPVVPVAEDVPAATPTPAPAPAAKIAAVPDAVLGKPAAGKGQIVFFRPSKFVGMAIGFKVREGATELGKLGNGNYFIIDVEPGTHEYVVHSEVKDVLPIEVDAGEIYYVQGGIGMGVMVGRPNLAPADKNKFETSGKMRISNL